MTTWAFQPSYKYDLAGFCNLFTMNRRYQELHPRAWERFGDLIVKRQEALAVARGLLESGFLVSSALTAVFDSYSYDGMDIDEICRVMEDPDLRETRLRSYLLDTGIMDQDSWGAYRSLMPSLAVLAREGHDMGFSRWWQAHWYQQISERSRDLGRKAGNYPVTQAVNRLLGADHALEGSTITVYLTGHAAPHGTSLAGQRFVSDLRWPLEDTVKIALHELLHPPFDRRRIAQMAETLAHDDLVKEGRSRLEQGSYASLPLFLEENIVEGAHIYLAHQMGLEDNPLEYFITHDNASHVISPLIYRALATWGAREGLCLEDLLEEMMKRDLLSPGRLRGAYRKIYSEAGVDNPF